MSLTRKGKIIEKGNKGARRSFGGPSNLRPGFTSGATVPALTPPMSGKPMHRPATPFLASH